MKVFAYALAGAAALVALPAYSQAQPWYYNPGLYAGLSISQVRYHGPDIGGLPTDRTSGAGKLWGGLQFGPFFATELGYADVGKTGSSFADVKTKGFFLDAVGRFPFTPELSGFGRVGGYWSESKTSRGAKDRSSNWKYGVGLQYDFDPHMGIRGEYERYKVELFSNDADVDMYSIGFNYKF